MQDVLVVFKCIKMTNTNLKVSFINHFDL